VAWFSPVLNCKQDITVGAQPRLKVGGSRCRRVDSEMPKGEGVEGEVGNGEPQPTRGSERAS